MEVVRDILENAKNWVLLSQRQARETLRSVYRVDDRYLIKKFELPARLTVYRTPWIIEHRACERLGGKGTSTSLGFHEETRDGRHTAWLVKDYVEGTPCRQFTDEDIPEVARLMVNLHRNLVITDDANVQNFMRDARGDLRFIDLGRAILHERADLAYYRDIGGEIAKIGREGFNWNRTHRETFRRIYFEESHHPARGRMIILASFRASLWLRFLRKLFTLKNPWS